MMLNHSYRFIVRLETTCQGEFSSNVHMCDAVSQGNVWRRLGTAQVDEARLSNGSLRNIGLVKTSALSCFISTP